jgi:hypothetical protein
MLNVAETYYFLKAITSYILYVPIKGNPFDSTLLKIFSSKALQQKVGTSIKII